MKKPFIKAHSIEEPTPNLTFEQIEGQRAELHYQEMLVCLREADMLGDDVECEQAMFHWLRKARNALFSISSEKHHGVFRNAHYEMISSLSKKTDQFLDKWFDSLELAADDTRLTNPRKYASRPLCRGG